MFTIPGTECTMNPYRATGLPANASNETLTDWCWMQTILHPYDQSVICEAGKPMDANTFFVLQSTGCDNVRIAKIDWLAEDAALQEWLDTAPSKPEVARPIGDYSF